MYNRETRVQHCNPWNACDILWVCVCLPKSAKKKNRKRARNNTITHNSENELREKRERKGIDDVEEEADKNGAGKKKKIA